MASRGFTIVELITVVVIVGALAVFVAPRLNVEGFRAYSFRLEVTNALRYAQKTALGSGCAIHVSVDAASERYALFYRAGGGAQRCGTGAFDDPVPNPVDGGVFAGTAQGRAGIASGGTVTFDGRGRTADSLVIAFEDGATLTIEGETGYVHP